MTSRSDSRRAKALTLSASTRASSLGLAVALTLLLPHPLWAAPKATARSASASSKPATGAKRVQHARTQKAKKKNLGSKFLEIPQVAEVSETSAYHYANMTNDQVLAELRRRAIPYRALDKEPTSVRFPIRLLGPLHGVSIHSTLPKEEWADTPFEILDGRLALALDDFCQILERHDIVELIHFTMYRPAPVTPDRDAEATRHPAGLAIDVGAVKKSSGQWLAVGPHWSSSIGSKTCGLGARPLLDRSGRELLSIVCEAADQRLFHYMLTPHFNRAHSDHLHLEIKPGVKWYLYN